MDSYNESRHHPSESIPDAAYPDAPYRPGEGQQDAGSSPHSLNTQSMAFSPASSLSPSSPSGPSTWSHNAPSPAPNVLMPDVPPPPYAPSATQSSASSPHLQAIPLQPLQPVASFSSAHYGNYYSTTSPQSPQRLSGAASTSPDSTISCKPGPLLDDRQRRRRRMKICLLVLGVCVLGMLALIMGVVMGVMKARGDDDDGDDGPPRGGPGQGS